MGARSARGRDKLVGAMGSVGCAMNLNDAIFGALYACCTRRGDGGAAIDDAGGAGIQIPATDVSAANKRRERTKWGALRHRWRSP